MESKQTARVIRHKIRIHIEEHSDGSYCYKIKAGRSPEVFGKVTTKDPVQLHHMISYELTEILVKKLIHKDLT